MKKIAAFTIIFVLAGMCMVCNLLSSSAVDILVWKETIEVPAPDFVLKDLDGNDVRLSDYRGKMVLLYFMTTWCVNCGDNIPYLNKIHKEYNDDDVVVLAIDIDEPPKKVRAYAEKNAITYRVLLGDKKTARVYNVIGVPSFILINEEGIILCRQCRSIDMYLKKIS